jgi:Non-histone chromosomal protein MC1
MTNTRNFVLRDEDGNENGLFIGTQPRHAALKVANRSEGTEDRPVTIRLRERGTKKVHVYRGWRKLVKAPENRPAWMSETIWKPFAMKEKIVTLQ